MEARGVAGRFWATKYRRCGEEWLAGYHAPYEHHWQLARGLQWDTKLEPVSEAERLNGLEWKAVTAGSVSVTKDYLPNGGWQPWQNGIGMGPFGQGLMQVRIAKLKAAAPSIETNALDKQYAPPDCNAAEADIKAQAENARVSQSKEQLRRQLADAIDRNDLSGVDAVVKGGADVEASLQDLENSHSGQMRFDTALCYAVRKGNYDVISRLLSSGAAPNGVCFDQTPLGIAVTALPNLDAIRLLLKAGANPNFKSPQDAYGRTPLGYAQDMVNDPASHGKAASQRYQPVLALLKGAATSTNSQQAANSPSGRDTSRVPQYYPYDSGRQTQGATSSTSSSSASSDASSGMSAAEAKLFATLTSIRQRIPNAKTFVVFHDHTTAASYLSNGPPGACNGFLIIAPEGIALLTAHSTDGQTHSFNEALSAIAEIRLNAMPIGRQQAFHIRFRDGRNFNFTSPGADLSKIIAAASGQ